MTILFQPWVLGEDNTRLFCVGPNRRDYEKCLSSLVYVFTLRPSRNTQLENFMKQLIYFFKALQYSFLIRIALAVLVDPFYIFASLERILIPSQIYLGRFDRGGFRVIQAISRTHSHFSKPLRSQGKFPRALNFKFSGSMPQNSLV